MKRSLVCDAKKPCLQTTDIHHDWESKEMELARQAARAARSKSLKTKKGRASRPKQRQSNSQFIFNNSELQTWLLFRAGRPALCLPQIAFYVKIQIF